MVGSPVERTVVATTRWLVLAAADGGFASYVLKMGDGPDGKPKMGDWVLACAIGI